MSNLAKNLLLIVTVIVIISCEKKPNDRFVNIDEKKQHILELGNGEPTVVFIAGAGSNLTHFDSVQKEISKITKTLSYDKPGLGKSEMINSPRTVENMTRELNEILEKENIQGPFILVGHSLGGFVARYFLHVYPEKVIGMVLIDPGDEYLYGAILDSKTGKERRFMDSVFNTPDTTASIGMQAEWRYYHQQDSSMKTFTIDTNIPITLIESNKINEDEMMTRDIIKIKMDLYRKFQNRAPQTKIISTTKSRHFIQLSEPQLVVDAIKSVLDEVN